jgi:hypothetical protein
MRRTLATLAVLTLTLGATAACGDDDSSSSPAGSGSSPESGSGQQVIEVTFKGDSVTPNGDRVEVQHGQPVELKVTADAPGEIHVHSEPEQELEYDKGTSTVEIAPIDAPGIVDVESHSLDKTIVQLEVR